ncbi:hypothetical protein CEXT_790041 [Caerostris extrusa]|uniref:Uncharacterized protein n=1 Tax=Caerostris extrusa TaxID=172846 RepID=A0AAV4TKQ8_CAEEX|nr:hypothetical protein CEXT_790041 [Caerostris extrusa]
MIAVPSEASAFLGFPCCDKPLVDHHEPIAKDLAVSVELAMLVLKLKKRATTLTTNKYLDTYANDDICCPEVRHGLRRYISCRKQHRH